MRGTEAPASLDNLALPRHELVSHLDGLVEQASAVVAQIEDESLHSLFLEALESLGNLTAGRARKITNHEVAGLRRQHVFVRNGVLSHFSTSHGQLERVVETATNNADLHLGIFRPFELSDGLIEGHRLGRLAFDSTDNVSRAHAQAMGGLPGIGVITVSFPPLTPTRMPRP